MAEPDVTEAELKAYFEDRKTIAGILYDYFHTHKATPNSGFNDISGCLDKVNSLVCYQLGDVYALILQSITSVKRDVVGETKIQRQQRNDKRIRNMRELYDSFQVFREYHKNNSHQKNPKRKPESTSDDSTREKRSKTSVQFHDISTTGKEDVRPPNRPRIPLKWFIEQHKRQGGIDASKIRNLSLTLLRAWINVFYASEMMGEKIQAYLNENTHFTKEENEIMQQKMKASTTHAFIGQYMDDRTNKKGIREEVHRTVAKAGFHYPLDKATFSNRAGFRVDDKNICTGVGLKLPEVWDTDAGMKNTYALKRPGATFILQGLPNLKKTITDGIETGFCVLDGEVDAKKLNLNKTTADVLANIYPQLTYQSFVWNSMIMLGYAEFVDIKAAEFILAALKPGSTPNEDQCKNIAEMLFPQTVIVPPENHYGQLFENKEKFAQHNYPAENPPKLYTDRVSNDDNESSNGGFPGFESSDGNESDGSLSSTFSSNGSDITESENKDEADNSNDDKKSSDKNKNDGRVYSSNNGSDTEWTDSEDEDGTDSLKDFIEEDEAGDSIFAKNKKEKERYTDVQNPRAFITREAKHSDEEDPVDKNTGLQQLLHLGTQIPRTGYVSHHELTMYVQIELAYIIQSKQDESILEQGGSSYVPHQGRLGTEALNQNSKNLRQTSRNAYEEFVGLTRILCDNLEMSCKYAPLGWSTRELKRIEIYCGFKTTKKNADKMNNDSWKERFMKTFVDSPTILDLANLFTRNIGVLNTFDTGCRFIDGISVSEVVRPYLLRLSYLIEIMKYPGKSTTMDPQCLANECARLLQSCAWKFFHIQVLGHNPKEESYYTQTVFISRKINNMILFMSNIVSPNTYSPEDGTLDPMIQMLLRFYARTIRNAIDNKKSLDDIEANFPYFNVSCTDDIYSKFTEFRSKAHEDLNLDAVDKNAFDTFCAHVIFGKTLASTTLDNMARDFATTAQLSSSDVSSLTQILSGLESKTCKADNDYTCLCDLLRARHPAETLDANTFTGALRFYANISGSIDTFQSIQPIAFAFQPVFRFWKWLERKLHVPAPVVYDHPLLFEDGLENFVVYLYVFSFILEYYSEFVSEGIVERIHTPADKETEEEAESFEIYDDDADSNVDMDETLHTTLKELSEPFKTHDKKVNMEAAFTTVLGPFFAQNIVEQVLKRKVDLILRGDSATSNGAKDNRYAELNTVLYLQYWLLGELFTKKQQNKYDAILATTTTAIHQVEEACFNVFKNSVLRNADTSKQSWTERIVDRLYNNMMSLTKSPVYGFTYNKDNIPIPTIITGLPDCPSGEFGRLLPKLKEFEEQLKSTRESREALLGDLKDGGLDGVTNAYVDLFYSFCECLQIYVCGINDKEINPRPDILTRGPNKFIKYWIEIIDALFVAWPILHNIIPEDLYEFCTYEILKDEPESYFTDSDAQKPAIMEKIRQNYVDYTKRRIIKFVNKVVDIHGGSDDVEQQNQPAFLVTLIPVLWEPKNTRKAISNNFDDLVATLNKKHKIPLYELISFVVPEDVHDACRTVFIENLQSEKHAMQGGLLTHCLTSAVRGAPQQLLEGLTFASCGWALTDFVVACTNHESVSKEQYDKVDSKCQASVPTEKNVLHDMGNIRELFDTPDETTRGYDLGLQFWANRNQTRLCSIVALRQDFFFRYLNYLFCWPGSTTYNILGEILNRLSSRDKDILFPNPTIVPAVFRGLSKEDRTQMMDGFSKTHF